MTELIAWIAAAAERGDAPEAARPPDSPMGEDGARSEDVQAAHGEPSIESLPVHQFGFAQTDATGAPAEEQTGEQADAGEDFFEFARRRRIYRRRTAAMLRKYLRYSLETGRLPSLVGREFFRTTVTRYRVSSFEDRVIFVHDMENCLGQLDEISRQVLGRIVLQEYEHEDAARMFGCTRRTVHRWLIEAIDKLSDILIAAGLLEIVPPPVENPCQGGTEGDFCPSDEEQRK